MKEEMNYVCDYCGFKSNNKEVVFLHEELCPLNPKNQPCSQCENMIVGMGCARNVPIEKVDGQKVLCIFYKKGTPRTLSFKSLFNLDDNKEDN